MSLNLVNPFRFGAALPVGGWKELGRTTLGVAGDNITVSALADKRYYMILSHTLGTGGVLNSFIRLNNISTGTYSSQNQNNGGGLQTNTNISGILLQMTLAESFGYGYFANKNTKEKLLDHHMVDFESAGAANAPNRAEVAGKHAQTTNPINEIKIQNTAAGDFDVGSELVVLGWDPADNHTDNFWEELATDTLTATDSNVQLSITAKKYLWIQAYMKPTATLVPWLRFNNVSTGTPYAYRKSDNGETDPAPSASQNQMVIGTSESTPQFVNIFVINRSANEKLVTVHSVGQNTAGAGNAPTRRETVAKHALTGSQITEVDLVSSTSSFASGSEFKVWGHD